MQESIHTNFKPFILENMGAVLRGVDQAATNNRSQSKERREGTMQGDSPKLATSRLVCTSPPYPPPNPRLQTDARALSNRAHDHTPNKLTYRKTRPYVATLQHKPTPIKPYQVHEVLNVRTAVKTAVLAMAVAIIVIHTWNRYVRTTYLLVFTRIYTVRHLSRLLGSRESGSFFPD